MAAASSISNPNTQFSVCSSLDVSVWMQGSSIASCLALPATVRSWSSVAICGDGFVEGNETCDCGVSQSNCANAAIPDPCCLPNCQLRVNATCSNQYPCCSNCQIVSSGAGVVCRTEAQGTAPTLQCNVVGVCSGTSASCPPQEILGDGVTCQNPLAKAAAWIEANWQLLVVGLVGLIGLVMAWKLAKMCWRCCCEIDPDEAKIAPEKRGKASKFKNSVRASMRQLVGASAKPAPKKVVAVGGIPLPAGWQIKYTKEGFPVYINSATGERYDFRAGPPQLSPPPKYNPAAGRV